MSTKGSGRWEDITCHICQTSDLPVGIKETEYRTKRKGKKKKGGEDTDWVGCETCKNWVHPSLHRLRVKILFLSVLFIVFHVLAES